MLPRLVFLNGRRYEGFRDEASFINAILNGGSEMRGLLKLCCATAVIAFFLPVPHGGGLQAQSPREQPAFELRADYLSGVGLHFPSSMPSVDDLMAYQADLAYHQELTIDWELIPGNDRPVLKETVSEGSLSSNFSLLDRKQNVSGNVARTLQLSTVDSEP